MTMYYYLDIKNSKVSTVAFAPKGIPTSHEIREGISIESSHVIPFSMELHEVRITTGLLVGDVSDSFYDFQPNNMAWPVMSQKMMSIISSHLTGLENIEWKEMTIKGKTETRNYYVLSFKEKLDVLNEEKSIFEPCSGGIVVPCFDMDKIQKYSVFHCPDFGWRITEHIYVNERIKKDLIKSGIQELSFSKARVV